MSDKNNYYSVDNCEEISYLFKEKCSQYRENKKNDVNEKKPEIDLYEIMIKYRAGEIGAYNDLFDWYETKMTYKCEVLNRMLINAQYVYKKTGKDIYSEWKKYIQTSIPPDEVEDIFHDALEAIIKNENFVIDTEGNIREPQSDDKKVFPIKKIADNKYKTIKIENKYMIYEQLKYAVTEIIYKRYENQLITVSDEIKVYDSDANEHSICLIDNQRAKDYDNNDFTKKNKYRYPFNLMIKNISEMKKDFINIFTTGQLKFLDFFLTKHHPQKNDDVFFKTFFEFDIKKGLYFENQKVIAENFKNKKGENVSQAYVSDTLKEIAYKFLQCFDLNYYAEIKQPDEKRRNFYWKSDNNPLILPCTFRTQYLLYLYYHLSEDGYNDIDKVKNKETNKVNLSKLLLFKKYFKEDNEILLDIFNEYYDKTEQSLNYAGKIINKDFIKKLVYDTLKGKCILLDYGMVFDIFIEINRCLGLYLNPILDSHSESTMADGEYNYITTGSGESDLIYSRNPQDYLLPFEAKDRYGKRCFSLHRYWEIRRDEKTESDFLHIYRWGHNFNSTFFMRQSDGSLKCINVFPGKIYKEKNTN